MEAFGGPDRKGLTVRFVSFGGLAYSDA